MRPNTLIALLTFLLFAALPGLLMATFTISEPGYFGGDLSCYASSDTIMFVLFESTELEDVPDQFAKLYQTVDKVYNHKSHTSASLIPESRRDGILDS
ncbi:MAG: hypothetical protein PWP64_1615 [Candidatus Cloacimonadota bacterium]|nr:hypothetical protein [Candidatus Cloacimonadota bacterium]